MKILFLQTLVHNIMLKIVDSLNNFPVFEKGKDIRYNIYGKQGK